MSAACSTCDVWRGAADGAFQTFAVPRRATRPCSTSSPRSSATQDADAVLSLRLPRRHVRLVRHDGERPPALDLPHARARSRRRRAAARAAAQPHGRQGPGRRHDARSSTSGATRKGTSCRAQPARRLRAWCRRRPPERRRPTPASSASAAASAIRPATWSPGIQDYLGPAALNRAWTLVNDVRDARQRRAARRGAGDAGCHACHTHMSCTAFCPKAHRADLCDRRPQARDVQAGAEAEDRR